MPQSKREAFTPGPGVMEIIEEFMREEQYDTKSGAINRIIINFGRAYKRSKAAQAGQALQGSHAGYTESQLVLTAGALIYTVIVTTALLV